MTEGKKIIIHTDPHQVPT